MTKPALHTRLAVPTAIFVLTLLTFLPALQNDFVNWDDDVLFLNNPHYRGLGPDQITWMFTHAVLGHYQPITWLTHGLDYCLWGMNPFGYHLSNLLFHAAGAVFVYFLALRLLHSAFPEIRNPQSQIPNSSNPVNLVNPVHSSLRLAAAFAALLFALHPLRVESVAWVTERRDLVSTFFLIPCVLCYLRYAYGRGDPLLWYIASLALFALSLLSKAWGITLPLVLLVLDIYPLRRIRFKSTSAPSAPEFTRLGGRETSSVSIRAALLDKLPFALLAFVAGSMAAQVQSYAGMESLARHPLPQRLAQAAYGLVFYLAKSLLPIRLNPIYELPIPFDPYAPRFIVAAVALLLLVTTVILLRRRLPSLAAAFAIYVIILLPVLGFTQTGRQLVADRYSYLACIPFAILAAAAIFRYSAWSLPAVAGLPHSAFFSFAIVTVFSILTWRQCAVWRNSTTLWNHAIALDPDACAARNSLGVLLTREKRFDEAADLFQSCVDRRPDDALFVLNLAGARKELKQTDDAKSLFRRALDLRPKNPETLLTIAQGFSDLGDNHSSLEAAQRAIDAAPAEPRGPYAAGQALVRLGDVSAAAPYLEKSIDLLDPQLPPGALDPRSDLRAAMYVNACSILSDYFEKKRDYEKAALYRDKSQRLRGL